MLHQIETGHVMTDTEHHADETAGWLFDRATQPQRTAYVNVTAMAALQHGHGSRAHGAAVDLAKRQWQSDTKEARGLFNRTRECVALTGEVSEALSIEWDALLARNAMREAAE